MSAQAEARTLTLPEVAAFGRTAEALTDAYGSPACGVVEVNRPRFRFRATRERIDFEVPEQAKHITLILPGWDPAVSPTLTRPIVGVEYPLPPSDQRMPTNLPPGVELIREATPEEIDELVGMVNDVAHERAPHRIEIVDGGPEDHFIEVDIRVQRECFTALIDAPSWNRQRGERKQLHRPRVRGAWWLFRPTEFLLNTYHGLELDD